MLTLVNVLIVFFIILIGYQIILQKIYYNNVGELKENYYNIE